MTKKRENRKQVTFTTSKGRGRFELSSDIELRHYKETKRLAKLFADYERIGRSIGSSDLASYEALPSKVKDQFIKHGLREGTKSQKIPTLGVLLNKYFASRGNKSSDKRMWDYLTEYFGEHKRIDLITADEAAGIKDYLKNKRKKPKGKRGGCLSDTTIDRAVNSFKVCFKTAVAWEYLKASPFETVIKKRMIKVGLPVWQQFFVNCRRSCIRDKKDAGYTESDRTAMFGNSKMVREMHYDGEMGRSAIAALCRPRSGSGVPVPVNVPMVFPHSGEVEIFHFGLPNHERYFPTLPSDSSSVWAMIDNGAPYIEVIVAALLRCGYSGKTACGELPNMTSTLFSFIWTYCIAGAGFTNIKVSRFPIWNCSVR
jgi:hypothetical protein